MYRRSTGGVLEGFSRVFGTWVSGVEGFGGGAFEAWRAWVILGFVCLVAGDSIISMIGRCLPMHLIDLIGRAR